LNHIDFEPDVKEQFSKENNLRIFYILLT